MVKVMRWPTGYWHDTVQALRRSTRLVLCALGLRGTPLVTAAQPPPDVPRLGVLLTSHAAELNPYLEAFRQRRRELGWVDGCSCCYSWIGSHLPCVRRVPASVSARGVLAAASRHRGLHHTGAAPLPMDGSRRFPLAPGHERLCV
jgi:hypothetical protein